MTSTNLIKVGMADLQITDESGTLRTTGLGSCVGLTLYDPLRRIGGMAHIMLPSSEIARDQPINFAKYADTAIPSLLEKMMKRGADMRRLEAKLAGGAQMFAFSPGSDMMRIGPRNVEACRNILEGHKIPVLAADTGGNYGRTIELLGDTGILVIRSVNKGSKEL